MDNMINDVAQVAQKGDAEHYTPKCFSDHLAYRSVRMLSLFADVFFKHRYGHRAVVLETVAGVPGMVGAMLLHLSSLRHIEDDKGWIHTLLNEAENERMHLMVYVEIAKPTHLERWIIVFVQLVFFTTYSVIYIISGRTGHRIVGYLEEEAVHSYTQFLKEIDEHLYENTPAPAIAISYWKLEAGATLRDVVIATRNDEIHHRDTNHAFSDTLR